MTGNLPAVRNVDVGMAAMREAALQPEDGVWALLRDRLDRPTQSAAAVDSLIDQVLTRDDPLPAVDDLQWDLTTAIKQAGADDPWWQMRADTATLNKLAQYLLALARVERSSLGTVQAQRLRDQTPAATIREVLARAGLSSQLGSKPAPVPASKANLGHGNVTDTASLQASPALHRLPLAPQEFVGREDELALLDSTLASVQERSVTVVHIHGMPGVGKTALALRWAHKRADQFDDHFFLDLNGSSPRTQTPGRVLQRLLADLGVASGDIPAEESHRAALFRSLVADRRLLIVLDDAADATQVVPLVPGGPGCFVVVTARRRLEGLLARFGAVSIPVAPLSNADSERLITRLVGGEQESQAIADLADSCARLPLALRIAAVQLKAGVFDSVSSLVDELASGDRLDVLALDDDPKLAVRSAFDLSYDTLTPAEQTAFKRLAALRGTDFGAASLASLLDVPVPEARRVLRGLARKHLVEPGAKGRFHIHELLGEYAAERLVKNDAATASSAQRTTP